MSNCPVGLSYAATDCIPTPAEYDSYNVVQQRVDEYAAAVLYYVRRRHDSPIWRLYGFHAAPESDTIYLFDTGAASAAENYYIQRRRDGPVWIPVVPLAR